MNKSEKTKQSVGWDEIGDGTFSVVLSSCFLPHRVIQLLPFLGLVTIFSRTGRFVGI